MGSLTDPLSEDIKKTEAKARTAITKGLRDDPLCLCLQERENPGLLETTQVSLRSRECSLTSLFDCLRITRPCLNTFEQIPSFLTIWLASVHERMMK